MRAKNRVFRVFRGDLSILQNESNSYRPTGGYAPIIKKGNTLLKKNTNAIAKREKKTPTRQKALIALFQCSTLKEAAEMSGVSRRTLYHYLHHDPVFITLYQELKRQQLAHLKDELKASTEAALEYVTKVMKDESEPTQIRLAAASKILSFRVAILG